MNYTYLILTDASCDLPPERLQVPDVAVVPLHTTVGGVSFQCYPDEREMKLTDYYARLRNRQGGSTAAPSPERFIECAEPALQRGLDVLYIGLASTVSATFSSGQMAMQQLAERYPDRRILCVDSRSGSLGEGLLVEEAIKAREQGMDMDQVAQLMTGLRDRVLHCFTVDDLQHLARSGRLSSPGALLGSILQFKPILWLDKDVKIRAIDRARGMQKAINAMVALVRNKASDLGNQLLYIGHADALATAKYLVERLRQVGARHFLIHGIGPAIGLHGGPGALGVFFLGDSR